MSFHTPNNVKLPLASPVLRPPALRFILFLFPLYLSFLCSAGLWGCLRKPSPQSLLKGRLPEPAVTQAKSLDEKPWPSRRRMAGMDCGHRGPQKTQDGKKTKSQSQIEAETGRDRTGVSHEVGGRVDCHQAGSG